MRAIIFILSLCTLSACSKQSHFGFYTSNPENKPAFAGKELTLNTDGTFDMESWTDSYSIVTDEDGNVICDEIKRKGSGTYTASNGKLHLKFDNIDYASVHIQLREESNADSTWYNLQVELIDEKKEKVPSLMLNLLDKKGTPIQFLHCNEKKPCNFQVRKDSDARGIALSMMGTKDFIFMFNDLTESTNNFPINRCRGYYSEGTEISLPYKMTRSGIEYTNEQGRVVKLARGEK